MDLQGIIVLVVVWLSVVIPATYFLVKGSSGDCTKSEKAFTRNSAIIALTFVTILVIFVCMCVIYNWP